MSVTTEELESMDMSRTCEIHGEYQAKSVEWLNDKHMVIDHCTKCAEEERAAEEEEARKKTQEHNEKLRKSDLIERGVSPRYLDITLSTITPTQEQGSVYSALSDYLAQASERSLILAGTVGTGKTFLAQALAQDLSRAGKRFRFSTARQIIRDIRRTWKRDSTATEDDVIGYYVRPDYLFIDEVGIQYGTDSEQIAMFDIINGRYENKRPTILITNLDINGLKDIMGDRIIDRLRQDGGEMLAFNWSSLRK
jgi:DNA replication protein DnaC